MADQVKVGKVKYIGLSGCSADTIRRAHAVYLVAAVQFEYAAFTLDVERTRIIATCKELGIAVVAYSPLGRGLPGGQTTSKESTVDGDMLELLSFLRFTEEHQPVVQKLVQSLSDICAKYGAISAQIALAWLLAQGNNVIPIPGTTNIARLRENMGALKVKLSEEEEEEATREAAESFANISSNAAADDAKDFTDTPKLA